MCDLLDSTRTLGVPAVQRSGGSFRMPGEARRGDERREDPCVSQSMYDGTGGSTISDCNLESDLSSDISSTHIANSNGRMSQYQLHTVIGNGKFSTVWRAIHLPTGAAVAVKRVQIYEIMDAKQRTDCINEVKLLQAAANHPNIITYRDSFIENNELVITLDFCDCGDLGGLIKERSDVGTPLTEGDLWSIFSQLCGAVSHMHSHRIMHRDIKPSNVFLSAHGVVKLGDLGLSRYFSSKTAQAQSMVGTPYYMSPECIRGQPYEWSSDTWSLGCLLYELGALRNPFFRTGLNYYTLGKLITSCEYDPLPSHASPELSQLVAAMLQQDAGKRPSLHDITRFAEKCQVKYRDVRR